MIFQVIETDNKRARVWTGTAARALELHDGLCQVGRATMVADYKGRRLCASDLVAYAARENERHENASLAGFKRLIDPRASAMHLLQGSNVTVRGDEELALDPEYGSLDTTEE